MLKEIKYRIGSMTKSPHEMSQIELQKWQEEGKKEAKEYLFSINQPVVYFKDDVVVAEYADGKIERLK